MINGNYARKPVWRVIWLNREKETKHFPHASYWSHFSGTNIIYLKYEVKPDSAFLAILVAWRWSRRRKWRNPNDDGF